VVQRLAELVTDPAVEVVQNRPTQQLNEQIGQADSAAERLMMVEQKSKSRIKTTDVT